MCVCDRGPLQGGEGQEGPAPQATQVNYLGKFQIYANEKNK